MKDAGCRTRSAKPMTIYMPYRIAVDMPGFAASLQNPVRNAD